MDVSRIRMHKGGVKNIIGLLNLLEVFNIKHLYTIPKDTLVRNVECDVKYISVKQLYTKLKDTLIQSRHMGVFTKTEGQ